MKLMNNADRLPYEAPSITDLGSLSELTAAGGGSPPDKDSTGDYSGATGTS
jgi:hypothetical protein